jgi:hypothetical protein
LSSSSRSPSPPPAVSPTSPPIRSPSVSPAPRLLAAPYDPYIQLCHAAVYLGLLALDALHLFVHCHHTAMAVREGTAPTPETDPIKNILEFISPLPPAAASAGSPSLLVPSAKRAPGPDSSSLRRSSRPKRPRPTSPALSPNDPLFEDFDPAILKRQSLALAHRFRYASPPSQTPTPNHHITNGSPSSRTRPRPSISFSLLTFFVMVIFFRHLIPPCFWIPSPPIQPPWPLPFLLGPSRRI